jgi:F-type H+-transporting ATPase subunit epsilon
MTEAPGGGLQVEVVDMEGPLWSGKAEFVSAPTTQGSIGVYPRHQPLLALLGAGAVRIDRPEGAPPIRITVKDGFISIDSDVVTVATPDGVLLP